MTSVDFKISSNSFNMNAIAGNSLDIKLGDFITFSSGYVAKATGSDTIEGVSRTTKKFASTNAAAEKGEVLYRPARNTDLYKLPIKSSGTIAQADVGQYFRIDGTTQEVDAATKKEDFGQLQLKQVVSTTVGIFAIVNIKEDQDTIG